MIRDCNVAASQAAEIPQESKGRPLQTGRGPETRPASLLASSSGKQIILIDAEQRAQICQEVVTYDGVEIYRAVPGKRFESHEDAILAVNHRKKA